MNSHFKNFIPGIAWFFVVLFLICLPGSNLPSLGFFSKIYLDKWVHVAMFGILAFLFCWPFYKLDLSKQQLLNRFTKIAIAVSLWGLTTEFIQKFYITGREFELFDWAADSIGVLLAYWFCKKRYLYKT